MERSLKKLGGLWVLFNGKEYVIGLTHATKEELGEITYIQLPKVGSSVQAGDALIEVEAEKAVSEFESPLTGVVSSVSDNLERLNAPDEMLAWTVALREVAATQFANLQVTE